MTYTDNEIQQIHANIEKITAFLFEIAPKLGKHFELTFDEKNRYSLAFYCYGNAPTISGWRGRNFDIPFHHPTKPGERTIFDTYEGILDFCIVLFREWDHIKFALHTEIAKQNETRELIANFKI